VGSATLGRRFFNEMLTPPNGKGAIKKAILKTNLDLSTELSENKKTSTDIDINYTQYPS
jgi:hypothetical protein